MLFVDRERELADLERFWASGRAECIPVIGRRRVGKTFLLERFSANKRVLYHRCHLGNTEAQFEALGASLAELIADNILRAQPPATWETVFAAIERLATEDRLLMVIDEIPYWVSRDESVPSILQNWWDARGRHLNLMLVLCGSAVQMMEQLLTGPAPLAGCITGRMSIRPFDFRSAAQLLRFPDPVDNLIAYGILGGVPLYLSFFRSDLSIRENLLRSVTSPSSRLYVEPQAVFAAHHKSYDARQAIAVLRAIARGKHKWSDILQTTKLSDSSLRNIMDSLIGDLGLVERVLPVTETRQTRTYHTLYHLTDNFFRFWFTFVEPNQGHLEFGSAENIVDAILEHLPSYMGLPFEAMCRDWVRMASATGALPVRVGRVGTWWSPDHQIDVVGLNEEGRAIITGECRWRTSPFDWNDLERYLGHVRALGDTVHPHNVHLIFSKSGVTDDVRRWAEQARALVVTPSDMLAPDSGIMR